MKKFFQYNLILMFLFGFLFSGCEKEEVEEKKSEELVETEPIKEEQGLTEPSINGTEAFKEVFLYKDEGSILPKPTIVFNYPLGKELNSFDDKKVYRLALESYEIEYNGKSLSDPSGLVYSEDKYSVEIKLEDLIDSDSEVTVSVRVFWETQQEEGEWIKVTWDNQEVRQELVQKLQAKNVENIFYTENVQAVYPVPNQYNFHTKEYPKGYLVLHKNQNFWSGISGLLIRISNPDLGYSKEVQLFYDEEQKLFQYDMPQDLQNETIYYVEYVNKEVQTEAVFYHYHFRTSRYDRFEEKLAAMVYKAEWIWTLSEGKGEELCKRYDSEELFDHHDIKLGKRALWINGSTTDVQTGLVRLEAVLENNLNYKERIFPAIYASFEGTGFEPEWRSEVVYGLPPVEAMYIRQKDQETFELASEQIKNNSASVIGGGVTIVYNLSPAYKIDKSHILSQVTDYITKNFEQESDAPERLRAIRNLNTNYQSGDYQFKMFYLLPGINKITFEQNMNVSY